jgi:hypothetical protein
MCHTASSRVPAQLGFCTFAPPTAETVATKLDFDPVVLAKQTSKRQELRLLRRMCVSIVARHCCRIRTPFVLCTATRVRECCLYAHLERVCVLVYMCAFSKRELPSTPPPTPTATHPQPASGLRAP